MLLTPCVVIYALLYVTYITTGSSEGEEPIEKEEASVKRLPAAAKKREKKKPTHLDS